MYARAAAPWVTGVLLLLAVARLSVSVANVFVDPPRPRPRADRPAPRVLYPDAQIPVASHERATPTEVIDTYDRVRPSWNLGLRLLDTYLGDDWRAHRALIQHVGTREIRTYAIGDLLPYGIVLVAVGDGAVQMMVGDVELVYLDTVGRVRSVQDFRAAYEPAPLARAPADEGFTEALLEVMAFLRSEDPEEVQGAIAALLSAGSSAIGPLMPYADSQLPVATATYAFAGSDPRRPRVYGDLIIGILQAITGQSFGDPMGPGKSDKERQWIREQWPRWWGLP